MLVEGGQHLTHVQLQMILFVDVAAQLLLVCVEKCDWSFLLIQHYVLCDPVMLQPSEINPVSVGTEAQTKDN